LAADIKRRFFERLFYRMLDHFQRSGLWGDLPKNKTNMGSVHPFFIEGTEFIQGSVDLLLYE
jgi:hypothetical protein